MAKPKTMLVRIKPYDKARGHLKKTWASKELGLYRADRGWYEVPIKTAEKLKRVRQVSKQEFTPLLFDVCTHEEAKELARREAYERERQLTGFSPLLSPEMAQTPETIKTVEPSGKAKSPPEEEKPKPAPKKKPAKKRKPAAKKPAAKKTSSKKTTSKRRSTSKKKATGK